MYTLYRKLLYIYKATDILNRTAASAVEQSALAWYHLSIAVRDRKT